MGKEFIDKGFRLDLSCRIDSTRKDWLKRWGMDLVGLPVSMPYRVRAAVWKGTIHLTGVAPVLAVVAPYELDANSNNENIWYIGTLALQQEVDLSACLDAAEYGPNRLHNAIKLLAQFAPPDQYEGAWK